ncbi:hypothetical protein PENSPDRAFT_664086 [Peniophora sp. CONT]|nr:hypothetical protein PENSPDRAFT_664086 [Peniophora sp. CONT]
MPASSSYSMHTHAHTRLLLARLGRAVWNYVDDAHLLQGFAEVVAGFNHMKRRQMETNAPPDPGSMFLSDDPSSEPVGWFVDHDLPCKYTVTPVSPSLHFMPRDDLWHIVNTGTVSSSLKTHEEEEAAHAETLAYTIAYTVFRRSVARAHTQDAPGHSMLNPQLRRRHTQAHAVLSDEFARTFESPDVQLVSANRDAAGPFAWAADAPELACGMRWLLNQLYELHCVHKMRQADARACAYLASLDEEVVEDICAATDTISIGRPYSYELLRNLLCDALVLVRKMPDIPPSCTEPLYKDDASRSGCYIQ